MTTVAVKETVKEALLGSEEEPQLSHQTRVDFMQHAARDPESGDYYMNEEQFIEAIAPETEDYVCLPTLTPRIAYLLDHFTNHSITHTAQDQALAICHPLQCRRSLKDWSRQPVGLEQLQQPVGQAGRRI